MWHIGSPFVLKTPQNWEYTCVTVKLVHSCFGHCCSITIAPKLVALKSHLIMLMDSARQKFGQGTACLCSTAWGLS